MGVGEGKWIKPLFHILPSRTSRAARVDVDMKCANGNSTISLLLFPPARTWILNQLYSLSLLLFVRGPSLSLPPPYASRQSYSCFFPLTPMAWTWRSWFEVVLRMCKCRWTKLIFSSSIVSFQGLHFKSAVSFGGKYKEIITHV